MLSARSSASGQRDRLRPKSASRLGVDRTLVCRLESLGEIRKGRRLAVVGFPVLNKEEVRQALEREGVDFIF